MDLLRDPYAPLTAVESSEVPFRYFLADRCFDPTFEEALLYWLEDGAPWSLAETDFYEQWECDVLEAALPLDLSALVNPGILARLRTRMGLLLGARLGPDVQLVAHRLEPGQRIGIHNDLRDGGETHRLTVQLNRGLEDADGGFFMLFGSDDAGDVHRVLRPLPGSAIGFAISEASNHAVSRLHGGTRYTLVYSFYAERDG